MRNMEMENSVGLQERWDWSWQRSLHREDLIMTMCLDCTKASTKVPCPFQLCIVKLTLTYQILQDLYFRAGKKMTIFYPLFCNVWIFYTCGMWNEGYFWEFSACDLLHLSQTWVVLLKLENYSRRPP